MNRIPKPLLAGIIALLAFGVWSWWPSTKGDRWLGYVEGETLYIAAPTPGRLAMRPVTPSRR